MPEIEGIDLLQDLAIVMMVAGAVILIFHWLRQPVILGYIVAGVIIGPFTPPFPFIHDLEVVDVIAELGIILLMFSLGLEFSLKKLRRVGRVAVIGGAIQILIAFTIGYQVGLMLGWGTLNSLFLGAALSISSTALIVKVLEDQRRMGDQSSQVVFGILVFEDFAAIAMIAVFSGLGSGNSLGFGAVGPVLLKLTIFALASILLGLSIVPRLMDHVMASGRRELSVIVGLGLCFGMALLARSLDLSVAAGAFIAGALVAESQRSESFARTMGPIRDMFAAIFFVAIGMLLDPAYLVSYWPHILLFSLVLIVGKIVAGSVATFLLGYSHHTAIQSGMKLAQIGEFSLILVKVGQDNGTVDQFLYPLVLGVAALTTLTTPYLIGASVNAGEKVDRLLPPFFHRYLRSAEMALQRLQFQAGEQGTSGSVLRRQIVSILINLGLFTLIVLAGRVAYENLDILARLTNISASIIVLLLTLLTFTLATVPLIAIVHAVRVITTTGAESIASQRSLGGILNQPLIRNMLRNAVTIILLVVMAMLLNLSLPAVTAAPYLPFLIIGLALLVTAYLVWDSIRAFHQRVEDIVRERLLGEGEDTRTEALVEHRSTDN
jgi:CPA2 family monovalent cation:H+ antiporter-2